MCSNYNLLLFSSLYNFYIQANTNALRVNFSWKMSGTWTKNENKVKSLVDGIEGDQMILGQSGTVYQIAKVGGSSTALYGEKFVRNIRQNIKD